MHRPGLVRSIAIVVGLTLWVGLAGCATYSAGGPQPEPTSPVPSGPAPSPSEQPWQRFADPRMPYSFEIPEGFTVRENQSAYIEMGLYQFSVLDAQGEMQLSFMNRVTGLGGACPPDLEKLTVEEFDVIPLSVPGYMAPKEPGAIPVNGFRFAYRVSQLSDRVLTSMALTNEAVGGYCMYYNLVNVHDDAYGSQAMVFADRLQVDSAPPNPSGYRPREFKTMAEAKAFMNTDEYKTLRRILTSLQF